MPGRDHDWARVARRGDRVRPLGLRLHAGCAPPIRSTSSTRRAPPARPKGVVRDNGGHMVALEMVDAEFLRRRSRRDVVVRLRHRLGGRPQLHRLRAAAARLHLDPLRGQAGRHARCRRVLARHLRARRCGLVHRADRFPRHQEGRPAGQAVRHATISRSSARCFSPASAPIPTPCSGRSGC